MSGLRSISPAIIFRAHDVALDCTELFAQLGDPAGVEALARQGLLPKLCGLLFELVRTTPEMGRPGPQKRHEGHGQRQSLGDGHSAGVSANLAMRPPRNPKSCCETTLRASSRTSGFEP
jgi:hypothetical protein